MQDQSLSKPAPLVWGEGLPGYGLADIHIHTAAGDGLMEIPELLEHVEEKTPLDVIAITDHDEISGALEAREWVERHRCRVDVVVGMELTTQEGHLLALFLEEPVPSLKPLAETIEAVHRQGGLCIVPHPLSWLTRSVGRHSLERLMRSDDAALRPDGLEMINPTFAGRVGRRKARRLNKRWLKLAETGGSDAHFLAELGSAYTLFPGRSAADLKQGLLERTTRAGGGVRVKLSSIGFGQLVRQQCRGLFVLPWRLVTRSWRAIMGGVLI